MTCIAVFYEVYKENAFLLSLKLKIPIIKDLRDNEIIICYGAAGAPDILLEWQIRNPSTKYIIMNGENITSRFYSNEKIGRQYKLLCKKNITFHYSPYTADECLKRFNLPYAGLFEWDFINRTPDISTIDILFFGFISERRQTVETLLKKMMPQLNILFAYHTYNDDLVKLLLKSKYVINIPFYDDSALETHRIDQSIACGCKIISKKSSCEYLNDKYKDKVNFINDWNEIGLLFT